MKKMFMAIAVIVMLLAGTAAYAETAPALEIKLQLDNRTVTINGVASEGEAPYLDGESTLVPLRIITTAFGASLKWDGASQGITLKSGDKTIELHIDSLQATVNDVEKELPAAPRLKNETTMVPLRFIAETFGAQVAFDEAASSITITGSVNAVTGDSDGTDMNIDTGKTKIGNSYYGWSMNYPTGLVKDYMSFRESYVSFTDAKKEYDLSISVEEDQDYVSNDSLLNKIADEQDYEETTLDKRIVTDGGVIYAKLVSKSDEAYYEYRMYQHDDKLYTVYFTINNEKDYKDPVKQAGYQDLLNSFLMSYNTEDSSIKDLSTVKEGLRPYTNGDLGLKINLPADWNTTQNKEWTRFYNQKNTVSLDIRLSSAEEGDTVEKWTEREHQYIKEEYVASSLVIEAPADLQVSGISAQQLKYTIKEGNGTRIIYGIYLFASGYKLEMNVVFTNTRDNPALVESLIKSMELSGKINSSYGYIHDERDFWDRTKLEEQRYKSKGFAIKTPSFWKQSEEKSLNGIIYSSNAGSVSTMVFDNMTLEKAKQNLEKSFKAKTETGELKIISAGNEELAGRTGYKTVVQNELYTQTVYIVEDNGQVFMLQSVIRSACATPANLSLFSEVVKSFRLLE